MCEKIKPYDLYKTLYKKVPDDELEKIFSDLVYDGRIYGLSDDKGCWFIAEWWLMEQPDFNKYIKSLKNLKPHEMYIPDQCSFGPILVAASIVIREDKRNINNAKIIKGMAEAIKFLYPIVSVVAYHRVKTGKVFIRPIKEVLSHG